MRRNRVSLFIVHLSFVIAGIAGQKAMTNGKRQMNNEQWTLIAQTVEGIWTMPNPYECSYAAM